jgi:N-acetylated-alpha-linked acidic dipeptidase
LSQRDAKTLMTIPVLPISWSDALPLLRALEGPVAPPDWRGGLALTYHVGSGPARVHLMVKSHWRQQPLYNVIATLPGSELPDEWLVRGNHRDGWVYGAWDPLSGHVAMMAEAKAIGALVSGGWRPKRTLVYASWDGEEPGLLGSTEWAEAHAAELQQKAVLYLNSDENSRGFLDVGGSHTLQRLVNDVARTINDPQTGVSTLARLRASIQAGARQRSASEDLHFEAKLASDGADFTLDALGTGSDYTPFLQHLGIASLNVQYDGEEDQGGVYHSAYDTYEHYLRFGDPGLAYGVAEAQTTGHLMLRIANAELLPLQFGAFADYLDRKSAELHRMTDTKRSDAANLARLLDDKTFALATDPTRPVLPPAREAEVPALGFGVLEDAVLALRTAAHRYDAAYQRWLSGQSLLTPAQRQQLNALLRGMEQQLIAPQGLPGRDWYKHYVYAPGMLTGYGVKVLPAIREPIDSARWEDAASGIPVTARLLQNYALQLQQAAALLEAAAPP